MIVMPILLCLLIPLLALLILMRRWQHPWQLSLPLFLLRRACIDPSLMVEPRRMAAAHLPFEAAAQPRLRSGALLWASAATVTHTLADEADRAAILAAVKPLGFTPEKFLARCPILQEVEHSSLRGYIVRDGLGQRAYFMGEPAALLDACPLVWDQQERSKTDNDLQLLPSGEGLYGFAMAPVENGIIGPMTYLGSMEIITPVMEFDAAQALLPQGWTLCDQPGEALTLHIAPQPEGPNRLQSRETAWRQQLASGHAHSLQQGRVVLYLFIVQLMLGIAALVWHVPAWLVPVCGLLLLPGALHMQDVRPNRRSLIALAWLLLWPMLIGLFVQYAAPGSPALMLALAASAACLGADASAWRLVLPAALFMVALLLLIFQPALLPAAFCLVAGSLHGLVARWLRPVECS